MVWSVMITTFCFKNTLSEKENGICFALSYLKLSVNSKLNNSFIDCTVVQQSWNHQVTAQRAQCSHQRDYQPNQLPSHHLYHNSYLQLWSPQTLTTYLWMLCLSISLNVKAVIWFLEENMNIKFCNLNTTAA